MNFEVYCDESGLEALTQKNAHLYVGIGGIWLPSECRSDFKDALKKIKEKYSVHGEWKWKKVSPAFFEMYKDIIDFFFNAEYIRFRVILIEANKVDNIRFHNDDAELSFYKFYYQLIKHWIFDFNTYTIFTDLKENRNKGRLNELHRVLDKSNLTSDVISVQGLPSEQSLGIQLADLLTGLVVSKFNNELKSEAKQGLIAHVEQVYLRNEIQPTPKWQEKFNVFKINLQGGW
ncbi:DUF3800 domain-containing protein [Niabella yanshanensis]|uniref:DUF3800 domain-containing protein n=1 Tax=Niabella yanshanensis TaxID=577386 RepID=A0ABZ0WC37_9BACT|nr:DUF3800 domain-containing protein [Niabella yanshanensis]WQD40629.1 DUF3800 domain-containing protein [Niabella yanshanensis]